MQPPLPQLSAKAAATPPPVGQPGGNSASKNSALFRANPKLLRSPVPYHLYLQQQQQQQSHMQQRHSPLHGQHSPQPSAVQSLFRPQAMYGKFSNVNSPSPGGGDDVFKVPSVPVPKRKDDDFDIHDYLDLNNHSVANGGPSPPAVEVPVVDKKPLSKVEKTLAELESVDEELKSLVDSIHSEVAVVSTVNAEAELEKKVAVFEDVAVDAKESSVRSSSPPPPPVEEKVEDNVQEVAVKEEEEEKIEEVVTRKRRGRPRKLAVKDDDRSVYDDPPPIPKTEAKFKKFEEQYPGVHFEKWCVLPLKLQTDDSLYLVIEGVRRVGPETSRYHSSIIREIKGSHCVSTKNSLYWLHGDLDLSMMNEHIELGIKFKHGFFDGWLEYMQELSRTDGSYRQSSTIDDAESNGEISDDAGDVDIAVKQAKRKVRSESVSMRKDTEEQALMPKAKPKRVPKESKKNSATIVKQAKDEHIEAADEHSVENLQDVEEKVPKSMKESRQSLGRSRSGRKIKPPREYWNAAVSEPSEEESSEEEVITQVKLEWGTGKVRVLHASATKSGHEGSLARTTRSKRTVSAKSRRLVQMEKPVATKCEDVSSSNSDHGEEENINSSSPQKPLRKSPRKLASTENHYMPQIIAAVGENEAPWTDQERRILEKSIWKLDPKAPDFWHQVAENLPGRSSASCQAQYQGNFSRSQTLAATKEREKKAAPVVAKRKEAPTKLAGKNTLLRKRQIRQMIEDRAADYEDDFFGDSPRKTPASERKRKMPVRPSSSPAESPEVLKPINREETDGYVEALKRRKVMKTMTGGAKGGIKKNKPLQNTTTKIKQASNRSKSLIMDEASGDSDDDVSDDEGDKGALAIYNDQSDGNSDD